MPYPEHWGGPTDFPVPEGHLNCHIFPGKWAFVTHVEANKADCGYHSELPPDTYEVFFPTRKERQKAAREASLQSSSEEGRKVVTDHEGGKTPLVDSINRHSEFSLPLRAPKVSTTTAPPNSPTAQHASLGSHGTPSHIDNAPPGAGTVPSSIMMNPACSPLATPNATFTGDKRFPSKSSEMKPASMRPSSTASKNAGVGSSLAEPTVLDEAKAESQTDQTAMELS
jgi:hypothetical protein